MPACLGDCYFSLKVYAQSEEGVLLVVKMSCIIFLVLDSVPSS